MQVVVERAQELDSKWLAQERAAVDKHFALKRLYSILQEEKELGACVRLIGWCVYARVLGVVAVGLSMTSVGMRGDY
jgi:hypothetical protein